MMPAGIDLAAVSAIDKHGNEVVALTNNPWPRLTSYGSTWEPDVLIAAYQRALFPMPLDIDGQEIAIGWWSPEVRAVFYPDQVTMSKSTAKSARNFRVTFDLAFTEVMQQCGSPIRPDGWINQDVINGYSRLYEMGIAHSVEVWDQEQLVGGLYGVAIGGIFAGESMFHKATNASKVALHALARWLDDGCGRVIDSQWMTPHLASLGARELTRVQYVDLVEKLAEIPLPRIPV